MGKSKVSLVSGSSAEWGCAVTSLWVRNSNGEWESGVSLEGGVESVAINHIFYMDCSDYHYRVTRFFSGVDAWGKTHRMAEVEPFLRVNTAAYLKQHGLDGSAL